MIIGERLRVLRTEKNMSQGDIEERAGLKRCYVSRVENGHTVPSVETLEKWARALGVPLYEIFYEGEEPPALENLPKGSKQLWGAKGKEARMLAQFRRTLSKTNEKSRRLLLHMARKLAQDGVA